MANRRSSRMILDISEARKLAKDLIYRHLYAASLLAHQQGELDKIAAAVRALDGPPTEDLKEQLRKLRYEIEDGAWRQR
jgi:phage-related protein